MACFLIFWQSVTAMHLSWSSVNLRRTFLSSWSSRNLRSAACDRDLLDSAQWDLVDDMIEAEGWVLVVLLRLSPIVPWNLLNIAMATTRMHFLSFTIASAIGVLHIPTSNHVLHLPPKCISLLHVPSTKRTKPSPCMSHRPGDEPLYDSTCVWHALLLHAHERRPRSICRTTMLFVVHTPSTVHCECSWCRRSNLCSAGIGFESSVLTYFGSLAQDIHHIVGGKANPQGPVVYVLTGTSLVFCAIAAIVATVFVKCAGPRVSAYMLPPNSTSF